MRKHVVVVGGGYAGLTVARRLRGCDVTVVNPHGYMTYQPLLPETAAGTVLANHVVVPLRSALPGARVLTGSLTGLDTAGRKAVVAAPDGTTHTLEYDELVLASGPSRRRCTSATACCRGSSSLPRRPTRSCAPAR
jgi:NADH dehydrogenase